MASHITSRGHFSTRIEKSKPYYHSPAAAVHTRSPSMKSSRRLSVDKGRYSLSSMSGNQGYGYPYSTEPDEREMYISPTTTTGSVGYSSYPADAYYTTASSAGYYSTISPGLSYSTDETAGYYQSAIAPYAQGTSYEYGPGASVYGNTYPDPYSAQQQDYDYTQYQQLAPGEEPSSSNSKEKRKSSISSSSSTGHRCPYPGCESQGVFKRRNDLERHKKTVHAEESSEKHDCLAPRCSRKGSQGFTRVDHRNGHMKLFHHYSPEKIKQLNEEESRGQIGG